MAVFPDSFEQNLTFPFDSFNVEDLHSVDEGVITHLFPLLSSAQNIREPRSWDVIIGHCLGVDHVGHRVGPDHPSMLAKLSQMNEVLQRTVDSLQDDTLLIVLGDHGMDRRGDHGGDGEHETSSALWLYSKTPFIESASRAPTSLLPTVTFPDATVPHRGIQQIDLVPTLALLLGLPIPFNSLGTLVPEFFPGPKLERALALNSAQVGRFLDAYRASASGGELDSVWDRLQILRAATVEGNLDAHVTFMRATLDACRSMWARFDSVLMVLGLVLLFVSVISSWALFSSLGGESSEEHAAGTLGNIVRGTAAGATVGFLTFLAVGEGKMELFSSISPLNWVLFTAPLGGALAILASSIKPSTFQQVGLSHIWSALPLVLHATSFLSNSFILWEDRAAVFLLLTTLIHPLRIGFSAPTPRARARILGCVMVVGVCARLMSISTVCREEQQPYCHVTFFAGATLAAPPIIIRWMALPVSIILPIVLRKALQRSRSEGGSAGLVLPYIVHPGVLAGAGYWFLEWMDSADLAPAPFAPLLRPVRTGLAWAAIIWPILGGIGLWWTVPSCLTINVERPSQQNGLTTQKTAQITVLGYANAFGSSYLIFWATILPVVFATSQLTGQAVLAAGVVALLALLELADVVHDTQAFAAAFSSATPSAALSAGIPPRTPSFADVTPLALFAILAFFGTGHQAVIATIQWKAAFMLTPSLTYPLSPILVVLNVLGPIFLVALAAPLLVLWNAPPRPQPAAVRHVQAGSAKAALGMMVYFGALLLGSAVSAAVLRRHLMVWKVFAPRFMTAAVSLLAVDLAAVIGVGLGVSRAVKKVSEIFKAIDARGAKDE